MVKSIPTNNYISNLFVMGPIVAKDIANRLHFELIKDSVDFRRIGY